MEETKIFENPVFGSVRTINDVENNQVLFCAADVCKALAYTNPAKAVSDHVDEPDVTKRYIGVVTGKKSDGTDAVQNIPMNFVNESGLYSLIFGSTLTKAKGFKRWVTSEVLPSIRKTGSYGLPQTFAEALRLAADQQERIEEQAKQIEEQQKTIQQSAQEIVALNNKVSYTNMVLQCKETVTITQIAQDYGMSAKAFNSLLHDHGIQHKANGQWILYKKYIPCGYVQSDTIDITHTDGTNGVVMHTKWTQKGRLFIYNTLKQHDVLPLIEQQNKQKAV